MLQNILNVQKNQWLNSDDCTIKPLISYIKDKGQLREAQINAIETYLFLKIKGQNKPLWKLFSEGFFNVNEDLGRLNISQIARDILEKNPAARALFEFSRFKINNGNGSKTILPELENYIIQNAETIDYETIIKKIFYDNNYTDYLFSLPMGAGKTFLMASIIYLDLYFADLEPENKTFAHNFIILVPSGLKSSIIPSIKTIEKFDPTWVIPDPAATKLKRLVKFEVLDQPKTSKKSNKTQNPNVQKVNNYQPYEEMLGLVMVVNAEKVILDRLELTNQGILIEKTQEEKDRYANELRNVINKIPNLQIHIDEVHHAATDDVKLRQVVNKWNNNGTVNAVLGYSGTPYLSSPDKITVAEKMQLKFMQITNTVFYYPLTTAIKQFLKKPRVEQAVRLEPLQIIQRGTEDFLKNFEHKIYDNNTCAKLAIYCSSIERLEEEIYPFLVGEMKIAPDLILKYHKGNKKYKIPQENETAFVSLDTPFSSKKIVLLVQVGKEGWDCKSLAGVILSQKGDCPTNMVLQTSCRCLRQVDKNSHETAIIWLNEENAKALDKQLKDEQQTNIQDLNALANAKTNENLVERYPRIDYLKLPEIDFYQYQVISDTLLEAENSNPEEKIKAIEPKTHFDQAMIIERGLNENDAQSKTFIASIKGKVTTYNQWLLAIVKGSFNTLTFDLLKPFEAQLRPIFEAITIKENEQFFYNNLYQNLDIQADIRLAFHQKRKFLTKADIIKENVQMLIVSKLNSVADNHLLFPTKEETKQILHEDQANAPLEIDETEIINTYNMMKSTLEQQGMGHFAPTLAEFKARSQQFLTPTVKAKNQTFHYLPYNFSQSAFELNFLKEVLTLQQFKDLGLEIYYNGEKHLTNFRIECFIKKGKYHQRIGLYTPDFLVIQRKDEAIHKILIVETKGSGFAEQTAFQMRKQFVENEFIPLNNEQANYQKFQYLYLSDDQKMDNILATFNQSIDLFFNI